MAATRSTFHDRARAVIESIESGTVMTYGEVATEAGSPSAAKSVGALLSASDGQLPWWRVVNSQGRLVPGSEVDHARRLASEGVTVVNNRVRFDRGGVQDAPSRRAPDRRKP